MTKLPKPSSQSRARNQKTENQLPEWKKTTSGCEDLMPLVSPLDMYGLSNLDTDLRKIYHAGENIVTITWWVLIH